MSKRGVRVKPACELPEVASSLRRDKRLSVLKRINNKLNHSECTSGARCKDVQKDKL